MARPQTYDHLRSRKKPTYKTVTIALDTELADAYEEAKGNLERAKLRLAARPDDAKIVAEFDDAEATFRDLQPQMEEESVTFKFRSVGRQRFEDLVLGNPPTPDQQKEAQKGGGEPLTWNPDTFPIALICASIVEPAMQEHEVKDLWSSEDWSGAETMALFLAALDVNSNRRVIDLGKG